jgi:hypothetical protein
MAGRLCLVATASSVRAAFALLTASTFMVDGGISGAYVTPE